MDFVNIEDVDAHDSVATPLFNETSKNRRRACVVVGGAQAKLVPSNASVVDEANPDLLKELLISPKNVVEHCIVPNQLNDLHDNPTQSKVDKIGGCQVFVS